MTDASIRSALISSSGRGDTVRGGRGGRTSRGRGRDSGGRGRDRGNRKCTNCGFTGHTVDTCWDLNGKPVWANQAYTTEDHKDPKTSDTHTPQPADPMKVVGYFITVWR